MPFANPSAALVKAFLINGAVNIPGQYQPSESGSIPNANEGFGRVDMDATIGAGAAGIQVMLDEDGALDTGEDFRTTVDVAAGQILMMWVHAAMCSFRNRFR